MTVRSDGEHDTVAAMTDDRQNRHVNEASKSPSTGVYPVIGLLNFVRRNSSEGGSGEFPGTPCQHLAD